MKRAADDAVEARTPDVATVPHQATGARDAAERGGPDATGGHDFADGDLADDDFTDGDLPAAAGSPSVATEPVTQQEPAGVLTERQSRILEFERQWWRHAGSKEQAIRDTFDLSPTRYYQLLNALLDEPAALASDPTTVKRLRRMRATRTRSRRTPA